MAGWQEKFDVDWQAKPEPGGIQRIQGYIVSRYGRSAEPVRVLVQALDASGAAVGYRIAWVRVASRGLGARTSMLPCLPPTTTRSVSGITH